ncbi:MAG: DUF1540 domain-containing protein [Clostridiales bacterium]|nr:DUF1540 domain-containing protein [Candidatus Apopatocola equi]MCQ2438201.1 DUF1540 domain-containing protein [Oscillospiraceae bacterium]
MSEKKNCECVQNVGCCVKECRYHNAADRCIAAHISVANENASRKGDTFCATFENRC